MLTGNILNPFFEERRCSRIDFFAEVLLYTSSDIVMCSFCLPISMELILTQATASSLLYLHSNDMEQLFFKYIF